MNKKPRTNAYAYNWRSLCDGVEITRDFSMETARVEADLHAGGIRILDWVTERGPDGLSTFCYTAEFNGHTYRLEGIDHTPENRSPRDN